jgi:hypothetical protein
VGKTVLQFTTIATNPTLVYQLTGLSVEEFLQLLPTFQLAEAARQQRTDHHSRRKRRPGGGRKPRLQQPEDRLLFILVYFALYPIQEVQAFLFGLSQAQAGVWIHRLTPVLLDITDLKQDLITRKPADLAEVLRQSPELEKMIGGTQTQLDSL